MPARAGSTADWSCVNPNSAWRVYELPSGHDAMVDMPDRLTEILLEVA